jgi:hypothetical protein
VPPPKAKTLSQCRHCRELLSRRQHVLTQFSDLGVRPLAPKQISAQLPLELSDGAGEQAG